MSGLVDGASFSAAISSSLQSLGYAELRPKQEEALRNFVDGNDVFITLPTGSGKSLCFWILPLLYNHLRERDDSIALVVQPLTALMRDQVAVLRRVGVKAVFVGGADDKTKEDIKQGKYSMLFFSPECLLTVIDWRDMLHSPIYREQLVAFVVDEAHCVKDW